MNGVQRDALEADFLIAEVAAGVFAPEFSAGPGAGAGVAVADVQPAALAAAPDHRSRALAQLQEQRVGALEPEVGEALMADVADAVVPPVAVRMHLAGVVDVGDALARGVAAPVQQQLAETRQLLRAAALEPVEEKDRVGVVVAGDEVAVAPLPDVLVGPFEEQREGLAGAPVVGVEGAAAAAAATVVEVREVELLHVEFAHQVEQCR